MHTLVGETENFASFRTLAIVDADLKMQMKRQIRQKAESLERYPPKKKKKKKKEKKEVPVNGAQITAQCIHLESLSS